MNQKRRTLIFGGQARLPQELSASEVLQVVVEIEIETGKVLEAHIKPCPELIAGRVRQMLIGLSLPDGLNDLLSEIERRLFYKGKKAVITAIKDLVRELKEFQYRTSKGSLLIESEERFRPMKPLGG